MRISFHGAAGEVTGSCHLVEAAGRRILIDCGLFQGSRELDEDNADDFGFDPARVDALLLTHAHLDHCGRIPLLVARGFAGEIVSTPPTRDLARLVMLDSAHLQEEEAARRARHPRGKGKARPPLYDSLDVMDAIDRFGRTAQYGHGFVLFPGVRVTFFDAGHILGSASILLEIEEGGERRSVLFSGDIGRPDSPLIGPACPPADVDVVVMETTYGDRDHRSRADSVAEFEEAVGQAAARGGNIVIPTFALERAQELLYHLLDGMGSGRIPREMEIFLDSPMAISATRIFARHPGFFREEIRGMIARHADPFAPPNLHFVHEAAESMQLNRVRGGAILMAGSGMCTGGRVRHHLRYNLPHADCSVIFVGFAAHGTPARRVIDGARTLRLFGEDVPVRATIHTINGFSAHAGASELEDWHARAAGPRTRTFLVHGEDEARAHFAGRLRRNGPEGRRVETPGMGETFEL
ncbi:MBL fold metallo-hydrolase [Albimonas sp. CAU 1670]|uniref:MBL fold metallo-hydrolase n=1 Tax=Albimonas sp. CAU 1670 TaxID=3032599 RepID=UPI0023D9F7EB|nr:MBL fold metallo-hydrolase [Albimonas sp. CAU 1670]MDF2235452.1 MBL fold metallo-hydrolase [Albimonas sp. CAU 1670]